jgi:hypothetical protein
VNINISAKDCIGHCGAKRHKPWFDEEYLKLVDQRKQAKVLGRPRRRWEDGIGMDLREIGWGSVDWIQLAQDRDRWRVLVNTVKNLRVLAPRS